jgi:hypothetical protein
MVTSDASKRRTIKFNIHKSAPANPLDTDFGSQGNSEWRSFHFNYAACMELKYRDWLNTSIH